MLGKAIFSMVAFLKFVHLSGFLGGDYSNNGILFATMNPEFEKTKFDSRSGEKKSKRVLALLPRGHFCRPSPSVPLVRSIVATRRRLDYALPWVETHGYIQASLRDEDG